MGLSDMTGDIVQRSIRRKHRSCVIRQERWHLNCVWHSNGGITTLSQVVGAGTEVERRWDLRTTLEFLVIVFLGSAEDSLESRERGIVFNRVYRHVLSRGEAFEGYQACVYRGNGVFNQ